MGVLSHQMVARLHELEQRDLSCKDVDRLLLEIILQGLSDQRHGLTSFLCDRRSQVKELLGKRLSYFDEEWKDFGYRQKVLRSKHLLNRLDSFQPLAPVVFYKTQLLIVIVVLATYS